MAGPSWFHICNNDVTGSISSQFFMHLWDNKVTAVYEAAMIVLHAMMTSIIDGITAQPMCNSLQLAAWVWCAGCC